MTLVFQRRTLTIEFDSQFKRLNLGLIRIIVGGALTLQMPKVAKIETFINIAASDSLCHVLAFSRFLSPGQYATSRKVAGSCPDEVIRFLQLT
jgi:hypothetical protein